MSRYAMGAVDMVSEPALSLWFALKVPKTARARRRPGSTPARLLPEAQALVCARYAGSVNPYHVGMGRVH